MAESGQALSITRLAAVLVLTIAAFLSIIPQAGAVTSRHEIFTSQLPTGVENFDPGPTGGLFARKIRRAITTFQTARGLRVTGVIDKPTLRELRAIQPDWGKTPPPGATTYSAADPAATAGGDSTAEPVAPNGSEGRTVQVAASVGAEMARDATGVSAPGGPPKAMTVRLFGIRMSPDAFVALTTFLGFILTLGLGTAVMYRVLNHTAARRTTNTR